METAVATKKNPGINGVTLVGRLTSDPTLRFTESGKAVVSFGLAVAGVSDTTFLEVSAWQGLAELCAKFLSKGRQVAVQGRLKSSSWDQDGQKRSKVIVVAEQVQFLDRPKKGE